LSIRSPVDLNVYNIDVTAVTDPAAGAEKNLGGLENRLLEYVSITFKFTADANAANRLIYIEHLVGANALIIGSPPSYVTANEVWLFICNISQPPIFLAALDHMPIALPSYPFIKENDGLWIRVDNIQVADQIEDIVIARKIWIWDH